MNTHADKILNDKSLLAVSGTNHQQGNRRSALKFVDNRPSAVAQKKLQALANNSPKVRQLRALSQIAKAVPIASPELPMQRMPVANFQKCQGVWDAASAQKWAYESQEAGVGHVAERHVDIDALGLMARLATGDTNGNPASMFYDSPWELLAEILNENKEKINEWIEANTGGLILRKEVSNLKVLIYDQAKGGKGKFTPHVGDAKVLMVLNRTNTGIAANPREYYLVTAFPVVGVEDPGLSHNERRRMKKEEGRKKISKGQKKHNKKEAKRMTKAVEERLG